MHQPVIHHRLLWERGLLVLAALALLHPVFPDANLLHAEEEMTLRFESSAFDNGETIPSKYTCQGQDVSPGLTWSGVPEAARSLVLRIRGPRR